MNIAVLILLLAQVRYSEPRFIALAQAEVSKRQYSSKAKSSNVRDFLPVIGTVHVRMYTQLSLQIACTRVCVHTLV